MYPAALLIAGRVDSMEAGIDFVNRARTVVFLDGWTGSRPFLKMNQYWHGQYPGAYESEIMNEVLP